MPEQEFRPPRGFSPGGPAGSRGGSRTAGPDGGPGGSRTAGPDGGPGYPDEDAPPWANLSPARTVPRRARRAAARRRRRWLIMVAGLVAVAGSATAAVLLSSGSAPAPVTPGALVTTFQPGELRQVPDACGSVPAASARQYLPGQARVTSLLPVDGSAGSACDWTIDQPPVYRLLQLNLLAYAPSGLASGDGSATDAAIDAYAAALDNLRDPPVRSADPPAAVTAISRLGNEAFSAMQVFRRGDTVTDVATVMVRYHNVVVTVTLNGLEHSARGRYGPVSAAGLSAAALAFARAAEAALQ